MQWALIPGWLAPAPTRGSHIHRKGLGAAQRTPPDKLAAASPVPTPAAGEGTCLNLRNRVPIKPRTEPRV